MNAWDYSPKAYQQQAQDPVWHLERLINHDLGNKKIKRSLLEKYFDQLNISEDKKAFLELLLWDKPF